MRSLLHADAAAVEATVVLMRKNVLDFNDFTATLVDNVQELLGRSISFQLVSATVGDPSKFPFVWIIVTM